MNSNKSYYASYDQMLDEEIQSEIFKDDIEDVIDELSRRFDETLIEESNQEAYEDQNDLTEDNRKISVIANRTRSRQDLSQHDFNKMKLILDNKPVSIIIVV